MDCDVDLLWNPVYVVSLEVARNSLVYSNFLDIYFRQSRGDTLLYKAHLDVTYLKLCQSETNVRSFKTCKLKSIHVYFIPNTNFPTRNSTKRLA